MDSELYSDGPDSAPAATTETKGEEEGSATGLLPKSFFGSKELTPGNKCEVEIVKAYDDEIQVRYVAHKADSNKAEDDDDEIPADTSSDMYSDA